MLTLGVSGLILGPAKLIFSARWLFLGLRAYFVPEKTDLGPDGADLGPEKGLSSLGGGTDGRTHGQTDGQTDNWKFTPVSLRTSAPWGRCPKHMMHEACLCIKLQESMHMSIPAYQR